MTHPIVVAALYKFVTLEDYVALREPLLKAMVDNGIKGTLLIAEEGINGTVSGTRVLTPRWAGGVVDASFSSVQIPKATASQRWRQ